MIIRARVRRTFDRINAGDYMAMVHGLAPSFEYIFHGRHALGGRRVTRAAMTAWWERITRLLPGLRFDVQDVVVSGPPWRTRVAVRSIVQGQLPRGERYRNTVFQFLTLRWGKVTAVETIEDLQRLERALLAVSESGVPDAMAAPIAG